MSPPQTPSRRWRRVLLGTAALLLGGLALNQAIIAYVPRLAHDRELSFTSESLAEVRAQAEAMLAASPDDPSYASLPSPHAFREIRPLDDDASSWSNMSSLFGGAGVTVFDANNDGRLDVYLCHDGQNWTRPTDANSVLMDRPRYTANGLYINLGNDEAGDPRFAQVSVLAAANDTFVREELLVEDYLNPRDAVTDSTERYGRQSNLALAADFNADGLVDLLVGNSPPGMPWSSPDTWRVLSRFVDPIGRQARHSKQPLVAMGLRLVPYSPRQSLGDTRESARGVESQGANSLYLNLGDQDGDGLPEWKDVSREAGIEGTHPTYGLSAFDFDLDGDLDIYEANSHDLDFWPGGATRFAGGKNALFVNQLAETGALRFVDQADALGVSGVFADHRNRPELTRLKKLPLLPYEYSILLFALEDYKPDLLSLDGGEAEDAEISWATVVQDVDQDGYPDLWVANDLGYLRLYMNQQGTGFVPRDHARSKNSGSWMSFAMADFSGDGREDLFVGNVGGGAYKHEFVQPSWYDMQTPVVSDSLAFRTLVISGNDMTHTLLDGADPGRELPVKVRHSTVMPPETTIPNNIRPPNIPKASFIEDYTPFNPETLDPYEFAWGATPIDVQNDGRPDLYFHGCLWNRGGGIMSGVGSNPGRLLVNATQAGGETRLVDQTAEHHLFNIEELKYDKLESDGFVYRKSPSQNWKKRDMVYSTDRSVWVSQGVGIQERIQNIDLVQTAEFGKAAVAADLNGDGFQDLVLSNLGGYDSRASNNQNLKAMIDGTPQVLPPPDNNYPTLTNFEPGRTRVFINGYTEGHALDVVLIDDAPGSLNRDAIGASVVLNGQLLRVKRAGDGGFISETLAPLHFGLGEGVATQIEVRWPDRARTVSSLDLDRLADGTLVISKTAGLVSFTPREPRAP